MKKRTLVFAGISVFVALGCAHIPPNDYGLIDNSKGIPEGRVFYDNSLMMVYGDAAKAFYQAIQGPSLVRSEDDNVKPEHDGTVSLHCTRVRGPRTQGNWAYYCAIDTSTLTGPRKQK